MKITIKDVARQAGVSISTVSKVMNNNASISKETIEKVKQVMEKLSYYPNRVARNLVQQSTNTIGILMDIKHSSAYTSPFIFEILGGIEKGAGQSHFSVQLLNINTITDRVESIKKLVAEKRLDGIIFHAVEMSRMQLQILQSACFPFICIGKPSPGMTVSWVDIDNARISQLAINHLLEAGYTRPAFISSTHKDCISRSRIKGYKKALSRAGKTIVPGYIKKSNLMPGKKSGYHLASQLLALPQPPDSIIAANSFVAAGIIKAAREKNIVIPSELGIICIDNYLLTEHVIPPLTTIDIDMYELGVFAAQSLLQIIQKPNYRFQSRLHNFTLIKRQSTQKQLEKDSNNKTAEA